MVKGQRGQRNWGWLFCLPLTSLLSIVPGKSQTEDHHKLDKSPQLIQQGRLGNQIRNRISSCTTRHLGWWQNEFDSQWSRPGT